MNYNTTKPYEISGKYEKESRPWDCGSDKVSRPIEKIISTSPRSVCVLCNDVQMWIPKTYVSLVRKDDPYHYGKWDRITQDELKDYKLEVTIDIVMEMDEVIAIECKKRERKRELKIAYINGEEKTGIPHWLRLKLDDMIQYYERNKSWDHHWRNGREVDLINTIKTMKDDER
jgi:hypothetical protein